MKKLTGTYRLALALAILGSVAWQISDRIANNVFRPFEYFTFFTVDTSIITGLFMLYAAAASFRGRRESRLFTLWRLSLVSSYVIVGVVYNLLLRGLPPSAEDVGYAWPETPNNILHVVAPIMIVLDWLFFSRENRPGFRDALFVWIYPFAWLGFTLVRGFATDWWPYFFIDPGDKGGVVGMIGYILGIMAFLYIVAAIAVLARRIGVRRPN